MRAKSMDVLGTRCRIRQLRPDIIPLDPPDGDNRGNHMQECHRPESLLPDGYLTVTQVAAELRVSPTTIYDRLKRGMLEGKKFDQAWGIKA